MSALWLVFERQYNYFSAKIAVICFHGAEAAYESFERAELFGALRVVNNLLITIFVEKCKKT